MATTTTKTVLARMAVVALLKELKYVTAEKWDNDRLLKTVKQFPQLIVDNELSEPATDEGKATLEQIVSTLSDDGEIAIEGEHTGNGHTAAANPKKKGKGKMTTTATKGKKGAAKASGKKGDASKGATKKDEFGNRVGTVLARANAVLTHVPKTIPEIVKEAKLPWSPYRHLYALAASGRIVQSDKGFARKKSKK